MDEPYLEISCPFCRAPFKIKEAYAHLRGRCPSCSFRIEPIKPRPYVEQKVHESNEPMGLVPIDEEWPEPAKLVAWDDRPAYGVSTPTPSITSTTVNPAASAEIPGSAPIPFAPDPRPTPRPAAPLPPPPPTPNVQPQRPKLIRAEAVESPPARPAPKPPPPPPPKPKAPDPIAAFAPPGAKPELPKPSATVEVDILGEPIARPAPPSKAAPAPPRSVERPVENLDRTQQIPDLKPVLPPTHDPLGDLPPVPEPPPARDDLYRFADGGIQPGETATPARRNEIDFEVPPTPPVPPPEPPPLDSHSPYELSDAELDGEKAPPVPLHLFWTGVWNFAFRVGNLWPLFWLTLGFSILGFQISMMIFLYGKDGGPLGPVIGFVIGIGVLFMVIITGSYASTCFLAILQDTANSADKIEYPDHDWRLGAISLARLAWLMFLGLALPAIFFSMLGCFGYGLFILLTPALFSFCLLSALARDSWFMIFDPLVMDGLKRRPDVIPIVYIYSLLLLVICSAFAALAFLLSWVAVPFMALVFAIAWLTFARVLGRVGYAITEDPKKKRKKKKKKKKRKAKVAVEEEGEEDEDDDDVPEVSPEDSPA